jgi:hypothetical protein
MKKARVTATLKITSESFKEKLKDLYALKIYQIIYEDLKNPIAPWMAFKLCRDRKHNIPSWVLLYLDQCSMGISSMDKLEKEDLFKSLKFNRNSGELSFAGQYKQIAKYFYAVRDCYILSERGDRNKEELKRMADIFSLVAEKTELDEAVINKHYYRYRSIIGDMMKERTKGTVEVEGQTRECEYHPYDKIMVCAVEARYPTYIRN